MPKRCRRDLARRLLASIAAAALTACGAILGADDEVGAPSRPPGEDAGDDAGESSTADAGGDASTRDASASACVATGKLALDTAFGTKSLPLVAAKTTLAPNGDVVTIGRAACAEAGADALSMMRILPDGGTGPSAPPCFGVGNSQTVVSVAPSPSGYVVATFGLQATTRARVLHVSEDGAELGSAELSPISGYSFSYSTFALHVGGKIVWGGYRYSQTTLPARVGFLSVMSGGSFAVPADEIPASAATWKGQLYAAFVHDPSDGGASELVVRRFDVVGNGLAQDIAFGGNGAPRIALPNDQSLQQLDGLGSILVEDDAVTIAVPNGSSISLLRLTGSTWSSQNVPSYAPGHLVRSCDGALILGAAGPTALNRIVPGSPVAREVLPSASAITSLLRDAKGDLYVAQRAGAQQQVVRVRP